MKRLLLSACAAAVVFGAAPVLAQVGTPALDRPLAPIPAPRDAAYPGVITLDMDATDIDRRIVSVRRGRTDLGEGGRGAEHNGGGANGQKETLHR